MAFNFESQFENKKAKQDEAKKKSTIYTTDKINEIFKDIKKGFQADMNPFFMGDTELRDSGILFEYSQKEMQEIEKCAMDCLYFIRNYCKFKNDKGWTLVKLRDYQEDIIKLYSDEIWDDSIEEFIPANKNIILLASRQTSKTTTVVAYFCWKMIFSTDKKIAIVANKGRTANEILSKMKEVIKKLPFFLKPGIVRAAATTLTFENGCTITSNTTNPTAITGDSTNVVYLDECAHIPVNIADEFWKSVYPTMSSFKGAQLIVTSTPKGRENLFFRLYDGACRGKNTFKHYRVDWWQVPEHDEAWAAQMRMDFGEEEFAQEFELQFDVDSSKMLQAKDYKFMDRIKKDFKSVEFDGLSKELCDLIRWDPSFDPSQLTDEYLLNNKFLFVVDTAEGKETSIKGKDDSDWNVINIYKIELMSPSRIKKNRRLLNTCTTQDVIRYRQVGLYCDNENDEEQSARVLKHLMFKVFRNGEGDIDNSRVLLEMNFNGKNFLNIFKNDPGWYDDLVLKTYHTKPIPGQQQEKKFGFKTVGGEKGKSYFCELGAKMLAQRQIIVSQYDENPGKSTITQIQNFGKTKKGTYAGIAMHDDIAVTILFVSHVRDIEEFTWWLEDWIDTAKHEDDWKIGPIRELLKIYSEGDDEYIADDAAFNSLYGLDTTSNTQTYGSLMNTGNIVNPYINMQAVQNPYTQFGLR